jgi:putative membrane protein
MNTSCASALLLAVAALAGSGASVRAEVNEHQNAGLIADSEFLRRANDTGAAEVSISGMAQKQALDMKVRALADQMIADHVRANGVLATLARDKHVDLPAALEAKQRSKIDDLSKLSGADFDRAYLEALRVDHEAMVGLFDTASRTAGDADIRKFATDMLPTLQLHLDHVRQLQQAK